MSAHEITLPRLGETMEEAEIVSWLKSVGDTVKRGEPLLEVHTDKIAVEVSALQDGVLSEILAEEGRSVPVGEVIARLETSEKDAVLDALDIQQQEGVPKREGIGDMPTTRGLEQTRLSGKVRASPSARRLARELGVDLQQVSGSGPKGRITSDDVHAAHQAPEHTPAPAGSMPKGPVGAVHEPLLRKVQGEACTKEGGAGECADQLLPLTRIEQATARTTAQSFRDVPHFYVRVRCDASVLVARSRKARTHAARYSVNDMLVKLTALALKQHPRLNARYQDNSLTLLKDINIGIMTATPEGLVCVVVPCADTLSMREIHEHVSDTRTRLASGRAKPKDVSGASFSISNLGMYEVDEFSAIILPPNVAMLAVGTLQEDVFVEQGAMRFGHSLRLTLSADHRALGGVESALFLKTLRGLIESGGGGGNEL